MYQKRVVSGAPQDLFDIFRVLSKEIAGQSWLGPLTHGFVEENLAQESGARTISRRFAPPAAIETGSDETELSYTAHASANGW